ncbi:MAG TPA: hypothetical protein VFW31_09910 [Candidatus Angelobacter sp.]|nr:hypothetical protein [Candidatus Angelobacter sp.]
MLETVTDLIANKKLIAVKPVQILGQLHYVFTPKNVSARTGIDKTTPRRLDYPGEFARLLPGTLPFARAVANAPEVD